MKNFITNIPVLTSSFFISILSILFIFFFTSPQYKSEAVIEISSNQSESMSFGFLDGISNGSQELYQAQIFLESSEAINLFSKRVDIDKIYSNKNIKYLSRFSKEGNITLQKYLSKQIKTTINPESSSITISSFAFNSNDSRVAALELIRIFSDFIETKAKVAAMLKLQYLTCDLFFSKDQLQASKLNNNYNYETDKSTIVYNSARDVLLEKARKDKEICINQLNDKDYEFDTGLDKLLPKSVINNLQSNFSKNILESYYSNSANLLSQHAGIEIISEPQVPQKSESRNFLLYFIVIYLVAVIIIMGVKVMINLAEEFEAWNINFNTLTLISKINVLLSCKHMYQDW